MPDVGYKKRRHVWTKEEIIEKVKEWVGKYGEIPAASDWNGSDTRRAADYHTRLGQHWLDRAKRFEEGEWPWTGSVYKKFERWNNLIRAAGFEPRLPSRPDNDELPTVVSIPDAYDEIETMISNVKSIDDSREAQMQMYDIAHKALAVAETLAAMDSL